MSDILNQIKKYEMQLKSDNDFKTAVMNNAADDANTHRSLIGKIILDPKKDPDPYSLHGIPLHIRLQEMGWRQ